MSKFSILAAVFTLFLILETVFPLRKTIEPKVRRIARNLTMAIVSGIIARFSAVLIVLWAAEFTAENKFGVLHVFGAFSWPPFLLLAIELVALDYLIYHWHRFNHVVPFLWRFHQPHHLDHELDASTALRFHFFEIVLSGCFRTACILAIGFSLEAVLLFEVLVTGAAIFHHSNFNLPLWFENSIGTLLITPRRHWVHHRPTKELTDSCYGTVLTIWDRLHKTLKPLETDLQKIVGVSNDNTEAAASRKPDDLREALLSPFARSL
ncbi:MAG: sterol desaturase family protein [Bdellovibrionales bacterium]|nr:sterol desaturase family protein [Bdellovibrionales bacterium]